MENKNISIDLNHVVTSGLVGEGTLLQVLISSKLDSQEGDRGLLM